MSEKVMIPEKARIVGGSGEGTRKIYISREIYKDIFSFSKDKNVYQSGGVLLGNTVVKDGCRYVIIRAFIEAKHSDGTSNSITFTRDTWNYIDQEREKYPEYDLVGWMHTNPDTGCFASEYDVFFHTHMFEGKDVIAYIVDPVQIVEAFYCLEGQSLVKCDGFYIYTEAVMPKSIRPKKAPKAKKKQEQFIDEDEFIKLVEDVENGVEARDDVVAKEEAAEESTVGDNLDKTVQEKAIEEAALEEVKEELHEEKTVDTVKEAVEKTGSDNSDEISVEVTDSKASVVANDEAELRQMFEEAEKKVEADKSDLEAFTGKLSDLPEKMDETPIVRTSSKDKAVVAILIVLVIALAATLAVAVVRISQLEKDISKLYQNDEVIARYINTGEVGTTAAVVESATESSEGQSEAQATEEGNAGETQAAETKAE